MKVILNRCFGGFDLSEEAYRLYAKKKGLELYFYELIQGFHKSKNIKFKKIKNVTPASIYCASRIIYHFTKDFGDLCAISNEDYKKYILWLDKKLREDLTLIEVVEELGGKANSRFSDLRVVEIPDGVKYVIDDYDGIETLHQKVQEW